MKLNENNSFLYNQAMFFDYCMSDEEKYIELICVHEAGHMFTMENLGYKAIYAWNGENPSVCGIKPFESRMNDIYTSMAGDIAVMVTEEINPIPETCLGLYYNYQRFGTTDWQKIRSLTKSKKLVVDVAKILEETIRENYDLLVTECRVSRMFFNMFDCIPQIVELIDRDERQTLEKMFGEHDDYAETRKKLLDPKTAWDLCKHPNIFCS